MNFQQKRPHMRRHIKKKEEKSMSKQCEVNPMKINPMIQKAKKIIVKEWLDKIFIEFPTDAPATPPHR